MPCASCFVPEGEAWGKSWIYSGAEGPRLWNAEFNTKVSHTGPGACVEKECIAQAQVGYFLCATKLIKTTTWRDGRHCKIGSLARANRGCEVLATVN